MTGPAGPASLPGSVAIRAVRLGLDWRASTLMLRLTGLAVLSLLLALLLGRAELAAFAAPALWLLASGDRRALPPVVDLSYHLSATRCFEGEEVTLTVTAEHELDGLDVTLHPASPFRAARADAHCWVLAPSRWGRWSPGTVAVAARGGGWLWEARSRFPVEDLHVFPQPPHLRSTIVPARFLDRTGDHASRVPGSGIEFAGIRPYRWGDATRRINWASTSRRQALMVSEFVAERAVDIVVIVDTLSDVGAPGETTLDRAVRGAAAVARSYLRHNDRVGLVMLYGALQWLRPEVGERQFLRIIDAVLDARQWQSLVEPDVDRVPRTALPPGSLIVLFSPLLEERAIAITRDLRQRGFPVVVVDVLTDEPIPASTGAGPALALRLWHLERAALRFRLGGLGVPVLPWDGSQALDAVLDVLPRMPPGRRIR